jgi:ABC-2 type transport system ATP-binding protein
MNIKIQNMTKTLNHTDILSDINLDMTGGQVYGLHGINGCGKTMLMRAVAGLIHPTRGQILVNGKVMQGQNSFPENMGLLLENPAFLNQYTGFVNLKLLAQIRNKIGTDEIRESLKRVGLDPDDTRQYRKYSLGMKQRLGIACAIMEHPDLILLDEPFISLDETGVQITQTIIKEEKDRGALILLSSHDYELLTSSADQIFHLTAGKVTKHFQKLQDGTFKEASL